MSDKPQSPFDRFQSMFRPQADPRTAQDRAPRPPPNSHDTPDPDDGHAGDAAPALASSVAPGSSPLAAGVSQSSTNLRAARDPPAAQPASQSLLAPDSASASASASAPPDSSSLSDRAFGLSSYEPYVPLRPTVRPREDPVVNILLKAYDQVNRGVPLDWRRSCSAVLSFLALRRPLYH